MGSIERSRGLSSPAPLTASRLPGAALLPPLGTVVRAAAEGLADIPRIVQMGVDVFEAAHLREVRRLFGADARPDRMVDGHLVGARGQTFPPGTPLADVPGVTPLDNPNPSRTLLYVNGIMTPVEGQLREMHAIAERADAKVIGLHNATQGLVTDLAQSLTDIADKGRNPAVDTLADVVYGELKAGREVHLMGYSQGGLITARALFDVARRLRIEDGLSQAQVEQLLGHLRVETFGAASTRYPDGPAYVHYINNADPVPTLTGLGGSVDLLGFLKEPGRDAVVHRFTAGNLNPISNHLLDTLYMPFRVPFEDARAGRF